MHLLMSRAWNDLVVSIVALLDLGLGSDASRRTLLHSLAINVSGGDEQFAADVLDQGEQGPLKAVATLLGDPVFEAAYQEMPDDDKQEFPEVRKEQARSRVRQHVADRARQSRRARAAPLPKRRVRRRVGPAAGDPAPAALTLWPRREETPRQNLHQRPWPRPRREEPLRPRPWPQPRREETPCRNLHQRPWPRPRREEPLRSRWCRPRPQREKALQPRSRRHHRYRFQAEAMAEVSHGIDRRDFGLLELTVMACSRL